MKITKTFTPENAGAWRAWLAEKHASEPEIWLIQFKGGQAGVDYETSIEEALCFGWVDSIVQRIDEEKYARKFSPRRPGSNWSATNKARMERLIASGRMTPAGLAKYDPQARESSSETAQKIRRGEASMPEELLQAVEANPQASRFFHSLAPSRQRLHMGWVMSASKAETRQKRLAEVISLLEQGREIGLK